MNRRNILTISSIAACAVLGGTAALLMHSPGSSQERIQVTTVGQGGPTPPAGAPGRDLAVRPLQPVSVARPPADRDVRAAPRLPASVKPAACSGIRKPAPLAHLRVHPSRR